jgi:hypothetical protein
VSFSATYTVYALPEDGSLSLDGASRVGQDVEIANTSGTLDTEGSLTALGFDGPFDGAYSFVSKATGSDGADGFIAKDAHGHSFFFTTETEAPASQSLSLEAGTVPICFMEGTLIATPAGSQRVECLKAGDLVTRVDGSVAKVRWVGRQAVVRAFASRSHLPIRVRAGALADQVPSQDLYLSASHALRLGDVLVQAGCLVNGATIEREERVPPHFTYYHIETEDHCLILANGAPAETFIDNVDRARFDNWNERVGIGETDQPMVELDLPRVVAARQLPQPIRYALEERGRTIGFLASEAA